MDKFVKELLTEDVLVETAKRYGIGKEKVYFVGGFENFIFGFEANDKSFIVRISHSSHRDLDDIKSELDFVFYLAKNGARVSMPVATVSGNLVEKIDASDGSYFIISAFTKAEGRPPKSQDLNEEFLYSYGKTIGQFHKFTKNYVPSEGIKKRFAWYQDPLLMNAKTYLKDEDLVILDRLNELMESIKSTPITANNYGLIHTDVHMGNFFVKNNELTVFDFDDASYQYFVSDIAIFLFYLIWFKKDEERTEDARFLMTHFLKGYLSENQLSKGDFLAIDKFLKLREIVLYLVIHKTLNIEESEFAKNYIRMYRERIINKIPFVELDFDCFLHQ